MFTFPAKPRPKKGSGSDSQRPEGKKFTLGKRAAVLATSGALLVGIGAAGQATNALIPAATTTSTSAASSDAQMSIEKSEIRSNPAESPPPPKSTLFRRPPSPPRHPHRSPPPPQNRLRHPSPLLHRSLLRSSRSMTRQAPRPTRPASSVPTAGPRTRCSAW
ncbi:hypothetical protein [Arthrobacter sp. SD76]|uniref:hypothetical protein n=1 Tax=Arthrobacter sp. SD76 TaxID=3415007 RepID=UPI003C71E595